MAERRDAQYTVDGIVRTRVAGLDWICDVCTLSSFLFLLDMTGKCGSQVNLPSDSSRVNHMEESQRSTKIRKGDRIRRKINSRQRNLKFAAGNEHRPRKRYVGRKLDSEDEIER